MSMDSGNGSGPVIIQKAKKGHGGHHGGAWKVAYADFVTAMMALFIVLWIMAQNEEVKDAIQNYFNNPMGMGVGQGPSVLNGAAKLNVEKNIMNEFKRKELEKERLTNMGNDLLGKLALDEEFKEIIDQVNIEITEEGLRIEIMESSNDVFFEIGTAQINPKADKLLKIIGAQIAKLNNKVVIEGHTDSRPFPGGDFGYSNYELSSDRANTARRSLMKGGVDYKQVDEIRGYADNRLRNDKDPYDLVNRRISIIVRFSDLS